MEKKRVTSNFRLCGSLEGKEPPIRGLIDVNWTLCTGCRLCEHACSAFHEGVIWPEASRIVVYQFDPGPLDIPVLCHQCGDFPCIEACPVEPKVMRLDEKTGAVVIDQKRCLGRKKVVGSPLLYGTTKQFLLHFGLDSLEDLPSIEDFDQFLEVLQAQSELPLEGTLPSPVGSDDVPAGDDELAEAAGAPDSAPDGTSPA